MAADKRASKPRSRKIASEAPDSRRSPRQPYIRFIWFSRLEHDVERGRLARTVDVSEKGIGFITNCEMAVGERLFLVIATDFGSVNTIAKATHVYKVGADSYRVGAMIEVMAPTDKAPWVRLLEKTR